MATPVTVFIPPLPAGFCLSASAIHNLLTQITAELPGEFTVWNVGPNEPTIENRSKPWLKIDNTNSVWTGIFTYSPTFGLWLSNHWAYNGGSPPFNERRIFVGSLTDLETYDGGEPGTVSDVTGPFWEEDTDWRNKIPVGVGVVAGNPVTVVNTDSTDEVDTVVSANDPNLRGAYIIKPTGRIYDRSS